jgi:dTMP kinase
LEPRRAVFPARGEIGYRMDRLMFITFEGIEGCGKSTQAGMLRDLLQSRGMSVLVTREPGGSPIGEQIRHILLDPGNHGMVALAELLLYEASRCQHVEAVIKPALDAGKVVICDRFFDASTAYQGYARGLGIAMVEHLNLVATGGRRPDLTIVLDLPVEVGLRRLGRNLDRIEREAVEFHRRVRQGYLKIAEKEAGRVKVVNAAGTIDDTFTSVKNLIDSIGAPGPVAPGPREEGR